MSFRRFGRCPSARNLPRQEKASQQEMPLSNSAVPLRMVTRFQPSSASARRWPPAPNERTVRAMNSRRSTPVRLSAVSIAMALNASDSSPISTPRACTGGHSTISWDSYYFPSPLAERSATGLPTSSMRERSMRWDNMPDHIARAMVYSALRTMRKSEGGPFTNREIAEIVQDVMELPEAD